MELDAGIGHELLPELLPFSRVAVVRIQLCRRFLEYSLKDVGLVLGELKSADAGAIVREARVVVDSLHRDGPVLPDRDEEVVAMAVSLPGDHVEPLEPVRLAHQPAHDLGVLGVVELLYLPQGKVSRRRLHGNPEIREVIRLHAPRLLHEDAELVLVRADRGLDHDVAEP